MKATFLEYILKNAVNSSVTSIRRPMINKYPVPVPPMEVQQEIIYLLENLSSLTDELINKLEKEILERKKQYEYYRDNLLKPNDTIPMVTLKEISTAIYRGTGIKRDQVTENGVPCVRYGEIYTTYNTWFDECVSHTKEEYVMWSEMETSIHEAIKILARTMDDDKFEYIEAPKRFYDYGGYYGGDDGYYFIDYCNGNAALDTYETYAQSEEEAVGIFLIEHPDLCFGDVIEVYGDYENYKIDAWR